MAVDQIRITSGMTVISSEGSPAGTIKETRANDFLLDRPLAPDIYLFYTTAQSLEGETVTLNISDSQIDDLGWVVDPPATDPVKPPEGH